MGEILGTLIKTFKASFLPFFDELSPYLTPMWVSFEEVSVFDINLQFLTKEKKFLSLSALISVCACKMQGKDKTAEERRIAICIFDDVAEQCRETALK